MSAASRRVLLDRTARDAARASFDNRLTQVRADFEARGIGGRIADRVVEAAADIGLEAVDLAESHKGLIAGTLFALVVWIFRHPIIARIETLIGADDRHEKDW